jgi:excisionase family DNA binding protein
LQEIEDTPPFLRKPVETLLDELLADGDKFRISVERRIAGNLAEIEPNSSHGRSIDCDEAAGLLGLSDRRVRQLATEGLLSGVKVGRKWCFNLADVLAYARKVGM